MRDYIYLQSTINKGYIQKVSKADFMSDPSKYPYMIPLSSEATKAEDIYRNKIQPNEWKFAGQSFLSGATGGLYETFRLNSEEKELLGKYKQRSTIGGVFNFLGNVAPYIPALAPIRAVGLAAKAYTGSRAIGAIAAGATEAGVLAAHGTAKKYSDLVGKGKAVNVRQGADIFKEQYLNSALLVGGFGVGMKGLGWAAKGGGKGVSKALEMAGVKKVGQEATETGFALKSWGVAAEKVGTGKEALLGAQVKKESDRIFGKILKTKDPKAIKATDLLKAVDKELKGAGRVLGALYSEGDKAWLKSITPEKYGQISKAVFKVLDELKGHTRVAGVLTGDAKKLVKAIEKNLLKVEKKKGVIIRRLKPGVLNNIRTTRELVGHMQGAAKSDKQAGLLKKLYGEFTDLEGMVLGLASKGLSSVQKVYKTRYSTLLKMRNGITGMIAAGKEKAVSPSTFRDIARSVLLGGAAGGAIGSMGGVSMFLAGSMIGGTASGIARAGYRRPWHMSIYPDIAERANRYLSGGKFIPEIFTRNAQETLTRRAAMLQRLSTGVSSVIKDAAQLTKLTFFSHINDNFSDDEKRDVYVRLRDTATNIMRDPQMINQVSFGAAEVVSQAGGSSFGPQIQMGVIESLRKFIESFPKDRAIPIADDMMQKENRWSKRQLDTIGKRMQVFFEPDAVVEDIIEGKDKVTLDQVKFLRFFHPEYFNAIKNAILMGLNNGTLKLSAKQRLRLSHLFSVPFTTAMHPKLLNITEQMGQLNLARQGAQKEQVRKNLNIERKADSLKTAAERNMLNTEDA